MNRKIPFDGDRYSDPFYLSGWSHPARFGAARAFLGWTRQQLADRAIVALNTVIRLEQGVVDSRSSTLEAVRRAFETAGIEFRIAA